MDPTMDAEGIAQYHDGALSLGQRRGAMAAAAW
jgi:hypothetical protein